MKIPGIDEPKTPDVVISEATELGPDPGGTVLATPGLAPKLFDVAEIERRLEPFKADVEKLGDVVDNFKINNDADFERSAEMLGQAKKIIGAIDEAGRAVINPYYEHYKTGLNMIKALTNILEARVVRALPGMQNAYAHQKELARREAEKKAQDEAAAFQARLNKRAEEKGVEPVTVKTNPRVKHDSGPVKTATGSLSVKMVWDFEIVDIKSAALFKYVLAVLGSDYKKLAERALKKAVKAGVLKMKGVKFFERADTTHRTR